MPAPCFAAPALAVAVAAIVAPASRADVIGERVAAISQQRIHDHIATFDYPRSRDESWARAATDIFRILDALGYEVSYQQVQTTANVIVRIPGTKTPEQVFVLGAHFDTVPGSPGADDNASGMAAVLEVAHVLRAHEPESTIELVFFALEELGLLGSTVYAEAARDNGVDIIGAIALDMIGYTCKEQGCQEPFDDIPGCLDMTPAGADVGTFIFDIGNDASAGILSSFEQAACTYVPELETVRMQVAGNGECFPDTRRSDHAPFWDAGFRGVVFSDSADFRNPHYHRPTDTIETLDLEFATRVTRATLAAVMIETGTPPCPADVDASGGVGLGDLLAVLAAWGDAGGPADVDGNGVVDFGDVIAVLAAWGTCG